MNKRIIDPRPIFVVALLFTILFAARADAAPAVTREGYVACVTEEYLDDFLKYLAADDKYSYMALLERNQCIMLKKGLRVTITDAGFTRHEFSYRGVKLWTVAEALKVTR